MDPVTLGLIALGLVILVVVATHKSTKVEVADESASAPYKVEAPAQESAKAVEPAKEVTSETASKPAKAKKAPAAKPSCATIASASFSLKMR